MVPTPDWLRGVGGGKWEKMGGKWEKSAGRGVEWRHTHKHEHEHEHEHEYKRRTKQGKQACFSVLYCEFKRKNVVLENSII